MLGLATLLAVFPASALAKGEPISPNINNYVASTLKDFSANMHLVSYNADAGRQINKDFGTIYDWMRKSHGDLLLRFRVPDMMRIDGRFGASTGTYIVNEVHQDIKLGIGLHFTTNLADAPGKRKTLLDAGLLSNDYLSYTEAKFMGARPYDGHICAVFDVSYKDKAEDTSHRLIWINPETKVTEKREEYSQDGKLRSIWYYRDTKEIEPGVWMPTLIEIDDNTGQLAGETEYKNMKVNIPMPLSLFK